MVNIERSLFKN